LLLPSQVEFTPNNKFNIHDTFSKEIQSEKEREEAIKQKEQKKKLTEHPTFGKFFKMKKMGIPIFVIEQKIKIQGLDYEEFKNLENNTNNKLNNNLLKNDSSNNGSENDDIMTKNQNNNKPKLNFLSEIKDKKLKQTNHSKTDNKDTEKDKRVPSLDQILEALNKLKKSNCSSTM